MKQWIRRRTALILASAMLITTPGMHAFGAGSKELPQPGVTESASEGEAMEAGREAEPEEAVQETYAADEAGADLGLPAEGDGKDRLTLMIYGVGSDLERKDFALTKDLTEIIAGMYVAKETAGNGDLPVNVVVQTGGVSYQPTRGDGRSEAEKIKSRAKAGMEEKEDSTPFTTYDKDMEKLMDYPDKSHVFFKALTKDEYTGDEDTAEELGEAIDWSKNLRWELSPGTKVSGNAYLNPAKTPVSSQNENRSLTEADNNGVITELYDFVDTTMRDYPAEQYALILWDHGSGALGGFGSDERDSVVDDKGNLINDRQTKAIRADHIRNTFSKLKQEKGEDWKDFAFAGYDACLMSDMDDVAAWKDYTRYFIASEDSEGVDGWYFLPWMYTLTSAAYDKTKDVFASDETMDALTEKVGKEAVDSYIGWFKNGNATLALFDLRGDKAGRTEDAIEELSEALLDYIAYDPIEAYRTIYAGNRRAVNFSGASSGMGDLRSLCINIMKALPAEDRYDPEQEVYEKADALQKLLGVSENMIRYYRNTGAYETGKTAGGVTLYTPYADVSGSWDQWYGVYGALEGRQQYKDLMGTFAALYEAGRVLEDIFRNKDKYRTEEAAKAAIEEALNKNLERYKVSGRAEEIIDDAVYEIYEERIRNKDTGVVSRNGVYYSNNDHWLLVDDVYRHPRIAIETEDTVESLPLGFMNAGRHEEEGFRLEHFGEKELSWFYMSDKDGTYSYPVNLCDADTDDPLSGKTQVEIAAYLYLAEGEDGEYVDSYDDMEPVLLNVSFEEGDETGVIESYRTMNLGFQDAPGRYVESEKFREDEYIVPIYNYAEAIVNTGASYIKPVDKDGKVLLSYTHLKDAVFGRGVISENSIERMASQLKNWAYDEDDKSLTPGEDAKGRAEVDFVIRDLFQREYLVDAFATEPSKISKATVMLYGVGSDLERAKYALSYDMTELITGMTAAKNRLKISGNEFPVNVVADLGGVSYDPDDEEKSKGITREKKIENRRKTRAGISDNSVNFARYDEKARTLGGGNIESYDIFSCLTDIVSGNDIIDWERNQRYELLPLENGDDGSPVCLAAAKNSYSNEDERRNTPMTQSDEYGVTTELYDFVKTTMESYPSEQYILILWDHGGGAVNGFGKDERSAGSAVTSYNVKKTFEKLKNDTDNWQSLAFAGYDACLMGTVETADAWEGTADYLIGSEASEPDNGWDHTGWISRLCEKAAADGNDDFGKSGSMERITEEVGKTAVDDYVAWYKKGDEADMGTLALVKLQHKGLKDLRRAYYDYAGRMIDYIKDDPENGFSALFDIRNQSVGFETMTDLRNLAFRTEELLYGKAYAAEAADKNAKAAVDAARNLMKVFDRHDPVIYSKNTGYFEGWLNQDNTQLGGLGIMFPYRSFSDLYWEGYLDLYRKLEDKTDPWRDLVGSYIAIRTGGETLYDVYEGVYGGEEAAKAAISLSVDQVLKKEAVSADTAAAIVSRVPDMLYDKRVRPEDVNVLEIQDHHYYRPADRSRPLQNGVGQRGVLEIGGETYDLGILPAGYEMRPGDDNGIRLYNYGRKNCWLWMKDSRGAYCYPASVYETAHSDSFGDTMNGSLSLTMPAVVLRFAGTVSGGSPAVAQRILLNVFFDEKQKKADIRDYTKIDEDTAFTGSRIYDFEGLKGKDYYILPLYNLSEKLLYGGTVSTAFLQKAAPVKADELVISRGVEEKGLDCITEAYKTVSADSIYMSADYYLMDKFDKSYALKKKEWKSFGIRWKENARIKRLLPEGTLIKRDDFEALVCTDGKEDREETERYAGNILAGIKVYLNGKSSDLPAEGYRLPAEGTVAFGLEEADLVPEKMEPGYNEKTAQEKLELQRRWRNDIYPTVDPLVPEINIVKTTVSEDDPRSGMDKEVKPVRVSENLYRMTMVKGQGISLGRGQWTSDKPKLISVGKSNGKVSAKKATAESESVTLTNAALSPARKYEVTVVTPKIYEKTDNEGKTELKEAKTIYLNTTAEAGRAGQVTLSLMNSSVVREGCPEHIPLTPAWTSSNPKVAAVAAAEGDGSADCTVTAVAKGSAKITGWMNGKAYSCTVKVTDIYGRNTPYGLPKEFGLEANEDKVLVDSVTVNPGVKTALNYNKKKTGFVPKKAVWSYFDEEGKGISRNEAPAYADKQGKLVAVAAGFVTMNGEYTENGKTVSAEISVSVVPAPAKRSTYLAAGKSETLKYYKVKNGNAFWSSSDAEYAALDTRTKGKVKALKPGSSVITCSYNGAEYATTVYVEDPALDTKDARLSAGSRANTYMLKLDKGTRFVISAPGVYQTLNWKSGKPSCAFVDENGIIEGRSPGRTKVTTKINGITVRIDVEVR